MMDDLDQQLIKATQTGLPLTVQPYQTLAEQLGMSAEEVMQRLQAMKDNGIIRRIATIPNHYKLGYRYNGMTVWDVEDEQIDRLGETVGQLSFVSHCYQRPRYLPEWPYNLFAMVHGKTQASVDQDIQKMAEILADACQVSTVLYSRRILKKTGLRI